MCFCPALIVWPIPHFILTGGSLSETHQGAAWEGQTHLCQHVPEICREGLKGERLCFLQQPPEGGRSLFFKETDWKEGKKMLICFFSLITHRKKQRGWRVGARRTAMKRWTLRMEKRKLPAKQRFRWRCDYYSSSVVQTFVTSAICV